MLRITVTLHSAITGKQKVLGVMEIANTGDNPKHPLKGDYVGRVLSRRTNYPAPLRMGEVKNYPRRAYSVWRLVLRMLHEMYPEEKK